MILLRLFIEFFKIGLFAIGGGMATIPFLRPQPQYRLVPPQLIPI
ncbi:MAG: chromate transporter [Eisenbergiella sp.]